MEDVSLTAIEAEFASLTALDNPELAEERSPESVFTVTATESTEVEALDVEVKVALGAVSTVGVSAFAFGDKKGRLEAPAKTARAVAA